MQERHFSSESSVPHLGDHLRSLREREGLSQIEIVKRLKWGPSAYSRIENGLRAPLFNDLPALWLALKESGVQLTLQDRELYLSLAQKMIESRKKRHLRRSPTEWHGLLLTLAQIDGLPLTNDEYLAHRVPKEWNDQPPRREIGHLLGRENWLASVLEIITRPSPVKILMLQGPPGVGKSSELQRLANSTLHYLPNCLVILSEPSPLQIEEQTDVLEELLSDVLELVAPNSMFMPTTSLQARIRYVLECLAKVDRPVAIYLDTASHIMDMQGNLVAIWQHFFTQFAHMHALHRAVLIIASGERSMDVFFEKNQLMTITVPRLSCDEGSQLLQTLGVRNVSEDLLGRVVDAVRGMPVCLEWIVRLIRDDEWADFEEGENDCVLLERLLEDSALFGVSVTRQVQPLLDRVITRLSGEATTALQELAMAPVSLGAPALQMLYQSPKLLRELRGASLLVVYRQHVQLLPTVATHMRQGLSDDQVCAAEERLIQALTHWLNKGIPNLHEQEVVFTEVACLLLRHRHLLAAAEFVIFHGLSSQIGQTPRLARRVQQIVRKHTPGKSIETDVEAVCGKLLLHYYLTSYLGENSDEYKQEESYKRILSFVSTGQMHHIKALTQVHLIGHLMQDLMAANRFEEAQHLFDIFFLQIEPLLGNDVELHAALLSKQATLYNQWSSFSQSMGQRKEAQHLQKQAIISYESSLALLEEALQKEKRNTLC